MKMIKNLSKNVVKMNPNFHVREDLNFSDDGNRFKGFDYKGLPITTLRSENITYCSVRVDYLHNDFTYNEWSKTAEYRLEDEFNGVSEIDLGKLVENCERIIAKVEELNEKANNEVLDMSDVLEQLRAEYRDGQNFAEDVKTGLKWWNLSDYELKYAKMYFTGLNNSLNRICRLLEEIENGTMVRKQKKSLIESLEKYGYVVIRENDFYIRELKEYMAK